MVFFFLVPFSFLLALLFCLTLPFGPSVFLHLSTSHLHLPSHPSLFHPQPLLSRSLCPDSVSSRLIRYHGSVFAATSPLREKSRPSMKIGRASARVLAPPPSTFYLMGLLTLCVLGSYPDRFSEWWLQILYHCADLYCWDMDKSVFSSCVLSSFYIFRIILYGLWIRDISDSCDFGVLVGCRWRQSQWLVIVAIWWRLERKRRIVLGFFYFCYWVGLRVFGGLLPSNYLKA